jgi:hypothetical protein
MRLPKSPTEESLAAASAAGQETGAEGNKRPMLTGCMLLGMWEAESWVTSQDDEWGIQQIPDTGPLSESV